MAVMSGSCPAAPKTRQSVLSPPSAHLADTTSRTARRPDRGPRADRSSDRPCSRRTPQSRAPPEEGTSSCSCSLVRLGLEAVRSLSAPLDRLLKAVGRSGEADGPAACEEPTMPRRPHILLFNPDQWRGDVLGHVGNPGARTAAARPLRRRGFRLVPLELLPEPRVHSESLQLPDGLVSARPRSPHHVPHAA